MTESSGKVEIYLNLPDFSDAFSKVLAQSIAANITREAKQTFVAVSTDITRPPINGMTQPHGQLRNSIKTIGYEGSYASIAETPYAAAQEFGRPDLSNYTFHPYMRPASYLATSSENIRKSCDSAWQGAIKKAYKNGA
jgi:hypothetical protein